MKAPYGFGIDVIPSRIVTDLNPPQVVFSANQQSFGSPLGRSVNGLYLAYVGSEIVVVCNHSYWKIFPRP